MRLKIVGRHPLAHGTECVVFGYLGAQSHVFTPIQPEMRGAAEGELSAFGRWDAKPMRPILGVEPAPALVGSEVNADACRTSGRVVVLSHSWSGRLQINDVARRYTLDLYSAQTRIVLIDVLWEIAVDLSGLARSEQGAIRLPDLPPHALLEHIVEARPWFRFLEPDADFEPGVWRRLWDRRRPRTDAFKLQILSRLLPGLASLPAPLAPAAPSPPAPPDEGLRDQMRLIAAAVEGLALRARPQA